MRLSVWDSLGMFLAEIFEDRVTPEAFA